MANFEYVNEFPNHSEFYRDFHLLKDAVVCAILQDMGISFEDRTPRGTLVNKTEFEYEFERDGWDVVITITKSTDDDLAPFKIFVEYKSSIKEWGKQVDQFMRQIKKRGEERPILLSFDERFAEFNQALWDAKIRLVVLPFDQLRKLNTHKK